MDGERTRTIFHSGAEGQDGREGERERERERERSNGPETTRTDWVTTTERERERERELGDGRVTSLKYLQKYPARSSKCRIMNRSSMTKGSSTVL